MEKYCGSFLLPVIKGNVNSLRAGEIGAESDDGHIITIVYLCITPNADEVSCEVLHEVVARIPTKHRQALIMT